MPKLLWSLFLKCLLLLPPSFLRIGNTPDDLDRQVLAVGYYNVKDLDYYIVKNSWSPLWEMDGYILMSRKDNNCGMATDASYAILSR